MLVIDIAFFLLELGVGLVVGSLALMADAFHMVSASCVVCRGALHTDWTAQRYYIPTSWSMGSQGSTKIQL